jgi:hypothetical protein
MFTITTSLSLSEDCIENQTRALRSWKDLGFKILSVNTSKELSQTSKEYYERLGVCFIIKEDGLKEGVKTFTRIDNLIQVASQYSHIIFLINADIELYDKEKVFNMIRKAEESLCFVSRYNYDSDITDNKIEKFGLDVFVFNSKFTKHLPNSSFVIGKPLWDYWIPYHFALNGVKICSIHDKIAFHKNHPKRWNLQDWLLMAPNFRQYSSLRDLPNKMMSKEIRRIIIEKIEIVDTL